MTLVFHVYLAVDFLNCLLLMDLYIILHIFSFKHEFNSTFKIAYTRFCLLLPE